MFDLNPSVRYIPNMTTNNLLEMNSSYLEQNGYWFSEESGNWFQRVYRTNNTIKDKSVKFFGWERIDNEVAVESLMNGFLPADLEQYNDDAYELMRDQQLGL